MLVIGGIAVWALSSDSSSRTVAQAVPQKKETKQEASPVKPAASTPSDTKQKEDEAKARELKAKEEELEQKRQEEQRLQEEERRKQRERDLHDPQAVHEVLRVQYSGEFCHDSYAASSADDWPAMPRLTTECWAGR